MKRVFLVHGRGGNGRGGYFDWLKEELPKQGIEVISFEMPETNSPKIEKWVEFLEKNVKDLDEETYFVGPSMGGQAIMRFLEKLSPKIKIGGVVFVASWFNLTKKAYEEDGDEQIAKPWLEIPIDVEKVKKHTKNFLALFSEDDPFVPISDADLFKNRLNAKIILKKNEGHYFKNKEQKEIRDFILKC